MIKNNKYRDEKERLEIIPSKRENGHGWVVLKKPKLKPLEISKYYHDTAKGDLYVALHSIADEWFNEYSLGGDRLFSDVSFVYRGELFHIELDLGNMEASRLFDKIERYTQFSGDGEKVIFVLKDGRYKAGVTGTQLMDYCRERMLGNFVTATLFENFCEFPTADVLISPKDGRISISQLVG